MIKMEIKIEDMVRIRNFQDIEFYAIPAKLIDSFKKEAVKKEAEAFEAKKQEEEKAKQEAEELEAKKVKEEEAKLKELEE